MTHYHSISWIFPVKSHIWPREAGAVNGSGVKGGYRELRYDPNFLKKWISFSMEFWFFGHDIDAWGLSSTWTKIEMCKNLLLYQQASSR